MASYQDQLNNTTLPSQMAKALQQNYGLSASDVQGLTYGDLLNLGLNTAPQTTTTSNYYSGSQGNPTQTSVSTGGKQQLQSAALLKAIGKLSLGRQQQQQGTPQGTTVSDMLKAHPEYGLSALGAAAETEVGTPTQMIINPTPSGTPSSKSGVSAVGGVQASSDIAKAGVANWDQVAQQAGLSNSDVAEFIKGGYSPADVAKRFNVSGTSGVATPTQPGIFSAAPMPQATAARQTTAAAPPANAAAYSPMATPFAQAPAAPGLDLTAHTSALENAGKAMYAHFGLDPNTATHADIANFHDQLMAGMGGAAGSGGFPPQIGSTSEPIARPMMAGGQPGSAGNQQMPPGLLASQPSWMQQGQRMPQDWGPGQGPPMSMPPTPPQLVPGQRPGLPPEQKGVPPPPGIKQMTTGGYVPGRGNRDTVPALLTPGEYVIPKEQVQQLMGRAPVRMQSGGFVQDDDDDQDQPRRKRPPETRRKMLTAQSGSNAPAAQSSQPASSYAQSSSPPAAPGGYTGPTAAELRASANIPAGSTAGAGAYGTVGNWMSGQGSAGAAGSLGQAPNTASQAAGVAGGLASGLASAAKAYADSIGSWQVQPSHIPGPDSFKQQPPIQLQQYA